MVSSRSFAVDFDANVRLNAIHYKVIANPLLEQAESAYAQRDFKKAAALAERALRNLDLRTEIEYVIEAHNILGSSNCRLRLFDSAIDNLEKAMELGLRHLERNHPLVSDTHFYMGQFFDFISDGPKSLHHHQQALEIRSKLYGQPHIKVAESLKGIGELYTFSFFDYKTAVYFYQKSIQILEVVVPSDHYEMYVAYFNLGHAYRMLGDLDKALTYAFKASSVVNSKAEYQSLREKCYGLLADIYYGKTDHGTAIEYRKRSIAESVSFFGDGNYNLIQSYTNLGLLFSEMDQDTNALLAFRKSLEIYSRHSHATLRLKADNLLYLSKTFLKLAIRDSAKLYLRKYVRMTSEDHSADQSNTYRYLSEFYQHYREYDSAAFYMQKSLNATVKNLDADNILVNPPLSSVLDKSQLFKLFGDKGSILLNLHLARPKNMKTLTAAHECFIIADTLMRLSRNTYQQEGSKLFFADHYHSIYEKAVECAYLLFSETKETKYAARAFSFMEKSRAFLLAESLNKAEIFNNVGLPDSVREVERKLNTAMAAYRSQLEDPHHKISEQTQQRIQSQIFDVSQKQERLLDTIARLYPNYYQVKYQKLSSLADIQSFARKNDATIIEYFWGEEKIYALAISAKGFTFREVEHVDSLTQNIVRYFQSLRQLPSWKQNDPSFKTFFTNAHHIYNTLVGPLLENNPKEKVIIIRDGPLLLIPFESLPVSTTNSSGTNYQELDYLIRHYTVSYAHSADLLLKSAARAKPESNDNKLLGFSYSQLSSTENGVTPGRSINELPGAAREIQTISKILPGSYFLGEDATEEKFKSHAPNFDILHLAVHGKSDPEKQFSGSLFFKQSQDEAEDGELHVYELYDLSLKARLTVLSACESGVGKFFRGEGVFSIARGFAYAGCPSTVMTLWPVSDLASADIMGDFYSSLSEGEHIDLALRNAKLNYLKTTDPQLAHPAYWAAYISTGNMEPVIPQPFPRQMLWIAIAILAGLITLYGFKKRAQSHPARKDFASASRSID